jgi:hypothetical protein
LEAVAVKLTELPAQVGLVPDVCDILTDGVEFAFTVTVAVPLMVFLQKLADEEYSALIKL